METPKKLEDNNNMSSGLKMDLVRGKEYASQLQALLHKPILGYEESALAQQLAHNVFRSFNDSLVNPSLLMSLFESSLIGPGGEAVDRASSGLDLGFQKRDVEVNKNRRGCYKRRRDIESYVNVSPDMDDGYAWRKYGQKEILNLKYPR
ncbi:hypothetical protein LIER_37548 [Lithospermum erythrorhizon]|uniref:WRKY domain-containing protein n=1 Tax=Lithospermum erythrorhizon TaxID=34254 RepID=A0AAV3PLY5_LITER